MKKLIEKYANKFYKVQNISDWMKDTPEEVFEQFVQELLSANIDFRPYMRQRDWTTEALWYLGDKAQLDYHNNGWENYRFKNMMNQRHKLPNKSDYYYVIVEGVIMEKQWYDAVNLFDSDDDKITHWKEITLPKDL